MSEFLLCWRKFYHYLDLQKLQQTEYFFIAYFAKSRAGCGTWRCPGCVILHYTIISVKVDSLRRNHSFCSLFSGFERRGNLLHHWSVLTFWHYFSHLLPTRFQVGCSCLPTPRVPGRGIEILRLSPWFVAGIITEEVLYLVTYLFFSWKEE